MFLIWIETGNELGNCTFSNEGLQQDASTHTLKSRASRALPRMVRYDVLHMKMKKVFILIVSYIMASLGGAALGTVVWLEPSRLSDLPGFMMMAPLFQSVAALCSLSGSAPGAAHTGAQPIPVLLLSVCLLLAVISAVWYWRSRKAFALLVFGLSIAALSLPGTNMLYAAMST